MSVAWTVTGVWWDVLRSEALSVQERPKKCAHRSEFQINLCWLCVSKASKSLRHQPFPLYLFCWSASSGARIGTFRVYGSPFYHLVRNSGTVSGLKGGKGTISVLTWFSLCLCPGFSFSSHRKKDYRRNPPLGATYGCSDVEGLSWVE